MIYRVTNKNKELDKIYNISKLELVERDKKSVNFFYTNWEDSVDFEDIEDAEEFIEIINSLMNRKSIFKRIYELFVW